MNILITGGTGYIGSHTAIELQRAGHNVILFDNLSNSSRIVVNKLNSITGKHFPFFLGDIRNKTDIIRAIKSYEIEAVIHCAGLKAVGESVKSPISYYENNVKGSLILIEAMSESEVHTLVFSSSATVYGMPSYLPIDEMHPTFPTNPYGRTKLMVEHILSDIAAAEPEWKVAVLRYFNPVGCHASGLIGEFPNTVPNNLMPFILQVASGHIRQLSVFGNDYETPDGTGIRDYVHVEDIAKGHLAALTKISASSGIGVATWNLGTGRGYSVLDIVREFERANGVAIPYIVAPRRPGDIAQCYANPNKAKTELNWHAELTLEDMCLSAWKAECNQKNDSV